MSTATSRVAIKSVLVGAFVVALILAGVLSYYASGSPDGLNRVALDKGFSDTEKPHATADGPLAGYSIMGVDNERLAGGVAGVVGVVVVLSVASGLAFAVRRRRDEVSNESSESRSQSTG